MTKTLLSSIEIAMEDMVRYTSNYTETYTLYVQEANKPSRKYNHKRANHFFHSAAAWSQRAIEYAQDLGLDPEIVCRDCVNFLNSYKGDWKKVVA